KEGAFLVLAEIVNAHDMGMVEPGNGFGFDVESTECMGVRIQVAKHLESDDSAKVDLPSLINDPHAPGIYLTQDLVAGYGRPQGRLTRRLKGGATPFRHCFLKQRLAHCSMPFFAGRSRRENTNENGLNEIGMGWKPRLILFEHGSLTSKRSVGQL